MFGSIIQEEEGIMPFSLEQSSERTIHLLLRSVSPRIASQSCGIYSEASEWLLGSARRTQRKFSPAIILLERHYPFLWGLPTGAKEDLQQNSCASRLCIRWYNEKWL